MAEQYKIGIIGSAEWVEKIIPFAVESGMQILVLENDRKLHSSGNICFEQGNPLKYEDVLKFGEQVAILKVGTEYINIQALKELQQCGTMVYPTPEIIELIQDKQLQKEFFMDKDLPFVARWIISENKHELSDNNEDNRNTSAQGDKDLISVQTWQNSFAYPDKDEITIQTLKPKREIHVSISRNEAGTIECYEPAIMIMEKERIFFDFDIYQSDITRDIAMTACELAATIAEAIDLRGLMIVELLLAANGKLYINDLSISSQKHRTNVQLSHRKTKSVLLKELLLKPALQKVNKDELTILEPLAFRKQIIVQSLNTILCTNDIHIQYNEHVNRAQYEQYININQDFIEEKLSKAIMIQHLLEA
jgi:5-(carboxyamino)imidazole ribonucleotide synthase